MLLALAAIWGSSFMFIKVAVRELDAGVVVLGRGSARRAHAPRLAVPFMLGVRGGSSPSCALRAAARRPRRSSTRRFRSGCSRGVRTARLRPRRDLQASSRSSTRCSPSASSASERVGGARLDRRARSASSASPSSSAHSRRGMARRRSPSSRTAACYAAGGLLYAARRLLRPRVRSRRLARHAGVATLATLPFGIAQAARPGARAGRRSARVVALGVARHGASRISFLRAHRERRGRVCVARHVPRAADRARLRRVFLDEPSTATALGGLALILARRRARHGLASPAPPARARRASAVISIRRARARRRRLPRRARQRRGGRAVSRRPRRPATRERCAAEVERSTREPHDFGRFVIEVGRRARGMRWLRRRSEPNRIARLERLAVHPALPRPPDRRRSRALVPAPPDLRARLPPARARDLRLQRARDRHAERAGFVREGVKRQGVPATRRVGRRGLFALLREDLERVDPLLDRASSHELRRRVHAGVRDRRLGALLGGLRRGRGARRSRVVPRRPVPRPGCDREPPTALSRPTTSCA